MEREDVEQKLQEKANEIQPSEFKELWAGIQPRIEEESKKKKVSFYKVLAPIACCLLVICATLPFIFPKGSDDPTTPPPVYYLNEDLTTVMTDETNFLTAVQTSSVPVVDLSRFDLEACTIFETDTGVLKGGDTNFLDNQDAPTCMIRLKFYAQDVEVSDDLYNECNLNYTTQSGAVIEYKYESTFGKYYIKAEYKTVQYFMEYVGVNETVTQFFETFFQ